MERQTKGNGSQEGLWRGRLQRVSPGVQQEDDGKPRHPKEDGNGAGEHRCPLALLDLALLLFLEQLSFRQLLLEGSVLDYKESARTKGG